MTKKLLLSVFLLPTLAIYAQSLKVNGTQMCEIVVRHSETEDFTPKNRSSFKVSATATNIGQAPNGFGCGFGPLKPVSAHEGLNTIAVIHRSDFNSNGDNSSGSLRMDVSVDGGVNWNNNMGPIYNPSGVYGSKPGPARYMSCAIINPKNATSGSNAYLAQWAPTLDGSNAAASWGGQLMSTIRLDNTENKVRVDTSSAATCYHQVSKAFWRASETTTFGVVMDENLASGTPVYEDTVAVYKGVWNTTSDSLVYDLTKLYVPFGSNADGNSVNADTKIAFSTNGQTGYIVMLGYSSNYPTYGVYHPLIMKTTDGGSTWSSPQNITLDNLTETTNNQSLLSIYQDVDSTWTISNLSTAFDCDVTVDKNGNPHILTNICPAAVTTIPPSGTPGSEFSIFSGINGMVDIYSTDGGTTWKSAMVGFPQTFRGGYGADPSAPDVTEDNRPHCSRSADGSKIFFHWFDTDATLWGTSDNVFPDWWVSGYDVDLDAFNYQATNMTDDINTQGTATFGNIAPESWAGSVSGEYKHHCVVQQLDQTTNDFYDPTQYIYMTDVSVPIGMFEYEKVNSHVVSQNFPNPADGITRIRLNVKQDGDYELSIVNAIGQLVYTKELGRLVPGEEIIELDVSSFNSGIYVYSVGSDEGTVSKTMVIE